jgi:TonB family protein
MKATPKMPGHTTNSVAPLERRLHARQRLSAIVYLEIGTGNGGIVLNVSEEGLGFQAVGPLGKQSELRLRIKLPSTQTRIDMTAQIMWLSDSNRQAGVRFLDAQSDGPVQIQEWIRAQASPRAPWEDSSKEQEEKAEVQREQETVLEPRKDERPILISEYEVPELSREEPPEVGGGEMRDHVPAALEDPASSQKSEFASQAVFETEESPSPVRPAIEEEPSQAAVFQTPGEPVRLEPDGGDTPIVAPSFDESGKELALGWPTWISRTAAMAIPLPPDATLKPIERFVSTVESKTNSAPADVKAVFAVPPDSNRMLVWNRVAIAVLLALCSVLCFGIGTWVGEIVTRRHSSQAAAAPVNVVQTAEQGINKSSGRNAGRLESASAGKVHTGPSAGILAHEKQKFARSMSSPNALPAGQSAPTNLQEQNVATSATTKEQEINAPVATAIETSPAPENDSVAIVSTKDRESKAQVATAVENSAAATPSQRVVAGLTLKPSDRFNPCYLAYRVEAAYPMEALERRVEGVVKIQQVVGADGRVRSVKLLSGPAILAPAALEAARYWRYLPALLNGQPVETEQDIEIDFRLPD